jgi:F-type H+-transporting ATPase subunit b
MEKLWSEFSTGLFIWQTIIFLGLLFLLRKYAWNPILNAVEERSKSIEDAISAADQAKASLAELNEEREKIKKESLAHRDALLKDANETKKSNYF